MSCNLLLVDNFDSFTFNLCHLIGRLNGGQPPLVVTNNQSWADVSKLIATRAIEGVIISPGPGRPDCPADFGVCSELLLHCNLPIFGVCLGHQGIAHFHGARVVVAKEPRHGRLSQVTVLAEDVRASTDQEVGEEQLSLFSGVASPFTVVRYHSLVVDRQSLPETLLPLAETEDGALMGLRHTKLPHWGVQFHPESICSEFGDVLLQNFIDIAKAYSLRRLSGGPDAPAQQLVDAGCVSDTPPAAVLPPLPGSAEEADRAVVTELCLLWDSLPFPGDVGEGCDDGFSAAVHERLFSMKDPSFWLDSATASTGRGRFSFMGDATGPRSHLVEYMVDSGQLRTTVVRRGACTDDTKKPGATPAHSRSVTTLPPHVTFLQWIKAKLRGFAAPRVEAVAASAGADAGAGETAALPFEFWGGYVGYLGYELRHECGHAGRAPRQRSRPEEDSSSFGDNHDGESSGSGGGVSSPATASLVFADRFVAFDHLQRVAYVLSLAPLSPHTAVGAAPTHGRTAAPTHSAVTTTDADARLQAAEWVRQTRAALLDVAQCCLHTDAASVPAPPVASPVPRAAGSGDIDGGGEGAGGGGWLQVRLKREREQYQADIASCHSLIGLGETYEVCLTTQVSAEGACPDPVATYAELRRSNAAPYGALLRLMGTAVMSSSPERFIQVGRDGTVESKPIKGTCRRGKTPEEDAQLSSALQSCEKNRAENLMIVDLTRHDLGQVCKIGSIHVPAGKLFAIESYATVHQLVTSVRGPGSGMLAPACDAVDAVAACFPPGSMTGAPKHRTLQIIDELEQEVPRGLYAGSLGWLSLSGAADLSVVIRTLVATKSRVTLGSGGAIVHQSDPGEEFREVILKLRAPLLALATSLGHGGVDLGCCGKLRPRARGNPVSAAFTTMPWDAVTHAPADKISALTVWQPEMYIARLFDHCRRLGIALPSDFLDRLKRTLADWHPSPSSVDEAGQGLFRLELTATGAINVSTRVVQLPPDRSNVSAITAKAPWWDHQEAAGTKHGAWGAYIDAMRAARGNGAYCALLIDPDGYVVDADRMTPIIWDASGRLRYPGQAESVRSITTQLVLEELVHAADWCGQATSVPVTAVAEPFTLAELLHAREVVLIGSGMGVGRLTAVDGMAISPGAVLAIEEAPTGGARSPGGHHHQHPSAARESLFELLSKCLDRARARGWSNLWTVSEVPGL